MIGQICNWSGCPKEAELCLNTMGFWNGQKDFYCQYHYFIAKQIAKQEHKYNSIFFSIIFIIIIIVTVVLAILLT